MNNNANRDIYNMIFLIKIPKKDLITEEINISSKN